MPCPFCLRGECYEAVAQITAENYLAVTDRNRAAAPTTWRKRELLN